MKKRLTSFLLVLAFSFSLSLSAFAVDDLDYYSFSPVGSSEPSVALDWPVSTVAEYDSILNQIFIAVTTGNNIASLTQGHVEGIGRNVSSLLASVNTVGREMASEATLTKILSAIGSFATESSLAKLVGTFSSAKYDIGPKYADFGELINSAFGPYSTWFTVPGVSGQQRTGFNGAISNLVWGLSADSSNLFDDNKTLYYYVKNLSETLASEDDKQLAQNQKESREQAEQDFLNGKSGKTSLGKGDFSNASKVGGALNDTFNMGGASKVSDFLSGFGSAGSESQAWFSQTTANNLNAVEVSDGTQGVSTFSDDGETMVDVDPDPYNMANIFDRYDWLEGVNIDD